MDGGEIRGAGNSWICPEVIDTFFRQAVSLVLNLDGCSVLLRLVSAKMCVSLYMCT